MTSESRRRGPETAHEVRSDFTRRRHRRTGNSGAAPGVYGQFRKIFFAAGYGSVQLFRWRGPLAGTTGRRAPAI